jgi:hypothetical protein
MEDTRVVTVPDSTPRHLVNLGSSRGHPQWADIHLGINNFPQKSQGCVSFVAAEAVLSSPIAEALAASTVKVAGRDVLGSWKVLISLGAAPLLYGLYAFIATAVMIRAGAPLKYRLWTPFVVASALPFIGYAALKFGEAGMDVLKYDVNHEPSLRQLILTSQITTATDSVSSARASAYAEPVEGHERGIVQRARSVDQ